MDSLNKTHDVDLESGSGGGSGGDGGCYGHSSVGGSSSSRLHTLGEEHKELGYCGSEIVSRDSFVSECSVDVDLESKVHSTKTERDCRICHLSFDATNEESDNPIELGCSCKNDLAAAHKQCAEAWFKIKGNKVCEICGSVARNVAGACENESSEQWNEANDGGAASSTPAPSSETRNFWQGHRFLNFLLACMVFAFVISWLFHFNVPS